LGSFDGFLPTMLFDGLEIAGFFFATSSSSSKSSLASVAGFGLVVVGLTLDYR
jgi:hypothetical protein